VTNADARIVGDPARAAVSAGTKSANDTGSIPSSDVGAACSGLTTSQATGCTVQPKPKPTEATEEGDADQPRKPPTLYAPGEAHESSAKPSDTPQ
jgi:hypothetical protein